METLGEVDWDLVISGTGLPQSLLALALSRSGNNILHVDRNAYYGGGEAALSLQDAEDWAKTVNNDSATGMLAETQAEISGLNDAPATFRNAQIRSPTNGNNTCEPQSDSAKLGFFRAYSLALSPQIIYARSSLLPTLVSSKVYRQLEFLAVGSWWIYEQDQETEDNAQQSAKRGVLGKLRKIPGSREDVFADKAIDLRSKRSLMKLLRLASDVEARQQISEEWGDRSFQEFLTTQYGLATGLQSALHALTLSLEPSSRTKTSHALSRLARHLTSVGVFGPGFGSVIPKWGGHAEITQVACRACAVGGGVYVLGKAVEHVSQLQSSEEYPQRISVQFQGGGEVRSKWIAGSQLDLPLTNRDTGQGSGLCVARSISIVDSSLSELFPLTAEGAPPPAAIVIVFPEGSVGASNSPPVYLMIHSSETGECPAGQCVIYASALQYDPKGFSLLDSAIQLFVTSFPEEQKPHTLWNLQYSQLLAPQGSTKSTEATEGATSSGIITFGRPSIDLAFDDIQLTEVKEAWSSITGNADGFMQFEDRSDGTYDEDGDV